MKMKIKKLATLMSIFVILATSTTVLAYDESTYSGGGQAEITAFAYNRYTVTIPATIDFSRGQGDITVSNADIDTGYEIEVVVTNLNSNGAIDMTHKTKDGVTSQCYLNTASGTSVSSDNPVLATVKDTEISGGSAYTYFWGEMSASAAAGSYSGTMQYSLYCSKY